MFVKVASNLSGMDEYIHLLYVVLPQVFFKNMITIFWGGGGKSIFGESRGYWY